MEKNSRSIIANIIFLIISGFLILIFSLFLASLIKLQFQTSIKIFILSIVFFITFFFIVILVVLGLQTNQITKNQVSIIHALRLIFIAVEMQRLEPENTKLSKDIFIEDLVEEENAKIGEDILHKKCLGYWRYFIYFLWVIFIGFYILVTIACTLLILSNWDVITGFFS